MEFLINFPNGFLSFVTYFNQNGSVKINKTINGFKHIEIKKIKINEKYRFSRFEITLYVLALLLLNGEKKKVRNMKRVVSVINYIKMIF